MADSNKLLSEIKASIQDGFRKLSKLHDLSINVGYWKMDPDGAPNHKIESVTADKWMDVQDCLMKQKLWTLIAENGFAYAQAHQRNVEEQRNLMEKLLITITQLELAMSITAASTQPAAPKTDPVFDAPAVQFEYDPEPEGMLPPAESVIEQDVPDLEDDSEDEAEPDSEDDDAPPEEF